MQMMLFCQVLIVVEEYVQIAYLLCTFSFKIKILVNLYFLEIYFTNRLALLKIAILQTRYTFGYSLLLLH